MGRPRIIVLNANMAFLEMIRNVLDEEGYETIVVREHSDAFKAVLVQQPRLVMIELLISDPEAGLMVLNKMRLHPQTRHIPVIIASTATQLIRDNEDHLRSKGCDILLKPFDLEELLTIVETHAPLGEELG